MKILLDVIEAQHKNGAGEYARCVIKFLINKITNQQYSLFLLYDSSVDLFEKSFNFEEFRANYDCVMVDVNKINLIDFISDNKIDIFYSALLHYSVLRQIVDVNCDIYITIHDLRGIETNDIKLDEYIALIARGSRLFARLLKNRIISFLPKYKRKESYSDLLNRLLDKDNVHLITVSEYSKYAIEYYFNYKKEIQVFFSPLPSYPKLVNPDCDKVQSLLLSSIKYILLVNAGRPQKNAQAVLKVIAQMDDINIVTVGFGRILSSNHIDLPYLSRNDLELLYKNCYALIFPSFYEGFGYPPLEAMKYGKPVLCSNVCSMPGIYENAVMYFSPFYPADIFRCIKDLLSEDYDSLCNKSFRQYNDIAQRQVSDLQELYNYIFIH